MDLNSSLSRLGQAAPKQRRDVVFATPLQACQAMVDAGAVFTTRPRRDLLRASFTYEVVDGGDQDRCRAILASIKGGQANFYTDFARHVHRIAVAQGALA